MPTIQSYRDLVVWQQAMDLAVLVYNLTRKFPNHKKQQNLVVGSVAFNNLSK